MSSDEDNREGENTYMIASPSHEYKNLRKFSPNKGNIKSVAIFLFFL